MRPNILLKWLMLPLAALLIYAGSELFEDRFSPPNPTAAVSPLSVAERQALGIEGDTPRDTVATLVAQVKQLRGELQTALSDNNDHRHENQRLRQRESAIEQRIELALDKERAQLQHDRQQLASERQQALALLEELEQQLHQHNRDPSHADLPVGLGLERSDAPHVSTALQWIEPIAAPAGSAPVAGLTLPRTFGRPAPDPKADETSKATVSATERVYTVPTNATLMGSVAMTALIGRVPVDGTVNDPYPFKVVIGPDNLTANGIELPEVAGAVVSGSASGDWTLSCVRGQIRSITFVFNDGTIRTLPETTSGAGFAASGNRDNDRRGLGWISDPHGIPCVSGERRSNASQYLGTQSLITAAGAGVATLIDADTGRLSYRGSDGSLGTVGISGNEAMARVLGDGVQELSQWVNKLYGQAFAAVYVAPGAAVAVHIESPLTIDYDPGGRQVDHRRGGHHAPDLD